MKSVLYKRDSDMDFDNLVATDPNIRKKEETAGRVTYLWVSARGSEQITNGTNQYAVLLSKILSLIFTYKSPSSILVYQNLQHYCKWYSQGIVVL